MDATVEIHRIGEIDFIRMFDLDGRELPARFTERLASADTAWRSPTQAEIEHYVLDVLKRVMEELSPRSVEENLDAFELGWGENLDEMRRQGISAEALKPRYFRGAKYLRYDKTLIVSDNLDLEYDLFVLARTLIFWKYFRPFSTIYEFGCGSCANLLMLAELFPEKRLVGLDWSRAATDIAGLLGREGGLNIRGEHFDFFHPPSGFTLEPNSAVLTIHALEQLGDRFDPWLDFLRRNKAAIVVNYEPVLEFYDQNNLWDYLALLYSRKRGYLSGYWSALQELVEEGSVEIVEALRPHLGGVVHEASLLVWRPL